MAGQLKEGLGSSRPSPSRNPLPSLSSAGLLTLALTIVGRAPCLFLGAARPSAAPLPTPATPRPTVAQSRWIPIPSATGGQPAAPSWRQGRTHPQRLLLAGQPWGSDPLAALVLKTRRSGRHGPGPRNRRSRTPLASSCCGGSVGFRPPPIASNVALGPPGKPSRASAAAATLPGPSRRLSRAWRPAPPGRLLEGAPSPGPVGARAWPGAARQMARPAVSRLPNSSATARSQLAEALAEPWRWRRSPGLPFGNPAPAVNKPGGAPLSWPWAAPWTPGPRGAAKARERKRLLPWSRRQPASSAPWKRPRLLSQ